VKCVVHRRKDFAGRHLFSYLGSYLGRAGAAGLLLALVFGASARIAATQRGAPAAITSSDPAEALGETLTAACRQDQAGFANHLTSDSAEAYRALPEVQRVALLKRFVLLDDPGKALLSTLNGHTVVRCEASGVVSEMRFGESQVRENLAFIPVTVPEGDDQQSVRFGLVREGGQWKLLSVGLVLLDIPALAREWSESDVRQYEQKAILALRKIAEALKSYQTAYGKLPETLDELGPPPEGGFSPEKAGLLDADSAKGMAEGYRVRYSIVPASGGEDESERDKAAGFILAAAPVEYGKNGRRSFLLDSGGTLRGADKNGAVATAEDPRVGGEEVRP
jgi:type II secretory pathway pseudopilin PulG